MNNVEITGNKLDFGEWYLVVCPHDELDIRIVVIHKASNTTFYAESIEDAVERMK